MAGKREGQPSVCFLCLKSIGSNLNRDNLISSKFLLFAEHYLDIPIVELFSITFEVFERSFCKECAERVNTTCKLYDELCRVKIKLVESVGQLAGLLDESFAGFSGGIVIALQRSLAEQLEGDSSLPVSLEKVDLMRKMLARQCKLHSRSQSTPENIPPSKCSASESIGVNADDGPSVCVKMEAESLCGDDEGDLEGGEVENSNSSDDDNGAHSRENCDKDKEKIGSDEKSQPKTHVVKFMKKQSSHDSTDDGDSLEDNQIKAAKEGKLSSKSKPTIHTCNLCQKTYQRLGHLQKHMRIIHKVKVANRLDKDGKYFDCDICNKTFTTSRAVDFHKKVLHDIHKPKKPSKEKPVTCEICERKLKNVFTWQAHMKTIHNTQVTTSKKNRPFKCEICGRGATTIYNRNRHMKIMHPELDNSSTSDRKPHPCHLCPKTYDKISNLDLHLYRKHNEAMKVKCSKCPMEFGTRRLLTHHVYQVHKNHKVSRSFLKRVEGAAKGNPDPNDVHEACVVCGKEYKSWDLLRRHLLQTHEQNATEEEKVHKCYFCSVSFLHQQTVWAHLRSYVTHNFTKIIFPCDDMDHIGYNQWEYKSPDELEQHFNQKHKDCQVLKCVDCGWPFLEKSRLDLHRLVHLPKVNQKCQCPDCGNFFMNVDTLRDHYNSTHGSNLKLYRCSRCPWTFSSKVGLGNHLLSHNPVKREGDEGDEGVSTAEQEKPYACSECPRRYGTAIQLRDHKRGYHVSKQCQECGMLLPMVKMSRHMKVVHDKVQRVICTECGKEFRDAPDLKKHMSVHGQSSFVCQYCGKGSRNGGHLRRHIGRMHKDKLVTRNDGKAVFENGAFSGADGNVNTIAAN